MVARRDIEPGELVFTDSPAVIGPDNSSLPLCLTCWRRVTGQWRINQGSKQVFCHNFLDILINLMESDHLAGVT